MRTSNRTVIKKVRSQLNDSGIRNSTKYRHETELQILLFYTIRMNSATIGLALERTLNQTGIFIHQAPGFGDDTPSSVKFGPVSSEDRYVLTLSAIRLINITQGPNSTRFNTLSYGCSIGMMAPRPGTHCGYAHIMSLNQPQGTVHQGTARHTNNRERR